MGSDIEHSEDVHKLIAYADTAMYCVKSSGENNYIICDTNMLNDVLEKVDILKLDK